MSDKLKEDLRDEIKKGNVVAIVGTGVSIAATRNNPLASWKGLIEHGIKRCLGVCSNLPANWEARCQEDLGSQDLTDLLSVAEKVAAKLEERGEYRRWLQESAGTLEAADHALLDALVDLKAPVATTNYDPLLRSKFQLDAITWRDPAKVEQFIRGTRKFIFHLHGYFDEPQSIIFSIREYTRIADDANTRNALHTLRTAKTLLFIGCGPWGLSDPNFSLLFKWIREQLKDSTSRAYILLVEKDVPAFEKEHPPSDHIFVIPYKKHDDLPSLIRSLAPAKVLATSEPAPAAPTVSVPLPLPPRPAHCFGRDEVVETVVQFLLAPHPAPIPLLGAAGVGKSTVTLAAIHDSRVVERYGERRYFVRCDAAFSRAALVGEINRTLAISDPNPESGLRGFLAGAPAVLALDNLESPWQPPDSTLAVEELLTELAGIKGIATIASIRGNERPLGPAWQYLASLDPLPPNAARQAFLALAPQHKDDPQLEALLGVLEGLPLAITLLASTAAAYPSLESVLKRWHEERAAMLARGPSHRLSNLQLSVGLSLECPRMTQAGRDLLSLLALLPDGVLLTDLAAIFPNKPHEAADPLRKTALVYEVNGRLRALAPIRECVAARCSPSLELCRPLYRHFESLAKLGKRVGAEGGQEATARIRVDLANLETVLTHALEGAKPEMAISAAISLSDFVRFSGCGSSALLEFALKKAVATQDSKLQAESAEKLGDIALARSDHEPARQRFEEALPLYRRVGAVVGEANCIQSLGDIALRRSDHEPARQRFEEALPLYRRVGAVLGEANCIKSLGNIALALSDHETARQRFEEALPLYRRVGAVLGEANCIKSLGNIALRRSDHEPARQRFEEALPLYRRVGDVVGEANCIKNLGNIALRRSDHETARQRFEEALPLYRRVGDVVGEANCIKNLGNIALRRSDHETARQRFEEALPLYRRVGDVVGEANCIQGLGDIALRRSDHETARQRFEEALPLYRRVGDVLGEANCIQSLGDIALARSDHEPARQRFEKALQLYTYISEPYSIGQTHRRLARLSGEGDRCLHVQAAAKHWTTIQRPDLVQQLRDEFGTCFTD